MTSTTLEVKPQHMVALDHANDVRLKRAARKAEIAEGTLTVCEVMLDPPDELLTMALGDLLTCQHRWGRGRLVRCLSSLQIPEGKHIGMLTVRQRVAVSEHLHPGWIINRVDYIVTR